MKTVIIVGVGALGSHVALLLRNVTDLCIIDFDRVEQKNVQSQFHGKPHVGKLKTDSLKATMNLLYGIKVMAFSSKLVENNVDSLLGGADLIVDCLDNGAARRIVQSFARAHVVPCVHGALSAAGDFGVVRWDERFVIDDEGASGQATCENGAHLPFIAIVSAYLARSAQMFLHDGEKADFLVKPDGAFRARAVG